MQSPTIAELAKALSQAQGEMPNAKKSGFNPHYNSHFSTLEDCWEALRPGFKKYGLSVVQTADIDTTRVILTTTLLHSSGEWISGDYPLYAKDNSPQALGSSVSYGRRYTLMAITGLASEDEDGEMAEGRPKMTPAVKLPTTPKPQEMKTTQIGAFKTEIAPRSHASVGHISDAQSKRLWAISKNNGYTTDMVHALILKEGCQSQKDLNQAQYQRVCDYMLNHPISTKDFADNEDVENLLQSERNE